MKASNVNIRAVNLLFSVRYLSIDPLDRVTF